MHRLPILTLLAALAVASDYTQPSPLPAPWDYQVDYPDRSGVATATTYEVGPGKTYAEPREVPWVDLQPGDQVLISYRAAPYTDALLLCARGEATKWITVKGLRGPNGERPVFEGTGARMPTSGLNDWTDGQGMLMVQRQVGSVPGYRPGYLHITGLEIRNARPPATYTDRSGTTRTWENFSSGIYGAAVDHLAVTDCELHDNGLGLFVNSTNDADGQSFHLLVSDNHFHGNSLPGSFSEHNAYTEAIGTVYEYNWFGPPVAGTYGDNIKERSSGVVFRYNHIEGGGNLISLRDPDSNRAYERTQVDAWGELYAESAYVYGNTFVTRGYMEAVIGHGDGPFTLPADQVRRGSLYFYRNRVVSLVDNEPCWSAGEYYETQPVPLYTMINVASTTVVARNNLFYATSATVGGTPAPFSLFMWQGTADFQSNWINRYVNHAGGESGYDALHVGTAFAGAGLGGLSATPAVDPGFVDAAAGDFHTTAGSPFSGLAAAYPAPVILRGLLPADEPPAAPFVRYDSGNTAPAVSAATATPATVTATTSALFATASDDAGEAALTYSWSASPATVAFSANGTHAAKSSTATFAAAGTYTLTVTARDAGNLTATRSVTVSVQQTPMTVTVSPATVSVVAGASATLGVVVQDQFAAAIAGPGVTWTVASGGGSVTVGGVYTAPATAGSASVRATSGSATGTAAVTITAGGSGGGTGGAGGTGGSSGGCGGGVAGILLLALGCLGLRRRRV